MDLQEIESVIRPLIEGSGYFLYDLEMVGRTLRVSIEKEEGVALTDCVEISRLLNPVLDVEDVMAGVSYDLEVSSPGLDRKLRKPEHFTGAIGEKIHLTTLEPMSKWNEGDLYFDNRRNVSGVLIAFDGTTVSLSSVEGKEVRVPFEAITKASVDFEVVTTPKKGKKV